MQMSGNGFGLREIAALRQRDGGRLIGGTLDEERCGDLGIAAMHGWRDA
ncbi:MAG TPA: hypothetical protein VNO30_16985 [Kofleriaceae bacterium]|nr:hypothetical protein [Kofleriaceae bacterium]